MVDGGGASSSSVRFRGDGSGARSDGVNAPAAATAACDAMATRTLVLVRHGEGSWTRENRFCSWVDQPLSADGEAEARRCSRLLAAAGIRFDAAFSSLLTRAIKTAWLILEGVGQAWVPLAHSWRLNERHYGALVGLNRAQLALNHGEEQVKAWRRAYDVRPPPIDEAHPYFDEIHGDRRYASCDVPRGKIPRGESLRDVLERLLPYWEGSIVPELRAGKNVLVSAHGNSVRAIIKHLEARRRAGAGGRAPLPGRHGRDRRRHQTHRGPGQGPQGGLRVAGSSRRRSRHHCHHGRRLPLSLSRLYRILEYFWFLSLELCVVENASSR
uniref:phosphoglycerate mutase (2,3-diphosphoglycerate-dependent) n=2 Tax=Petromyzon marinus TaxID=7757 RepID=A0AAJ7WXR3_PETMA|nr:bisphosphoglycerate mutase-like isoform X1 [Petromyzon marinus]